MSIVSKWTIGAMASKKASASEPVSQDRFGQRGRGQRAGGDDHAVPVGRRQAGDLAALDGDQRMIPSACVTASEKPSRSTASAPPAGT
jgi:hypothetical protein